MIKVLATTLVTAGAVLWSAGSAFGGSVYGVGGGWMGFLRGERIAHFAFSAHESPNGDLGKVHWTLDDPELPLDVTVAVDCVNVEPNLFGPTAWMDGVVTSVSPQPNFASVMMGDRLAFEAIDGGEPSPPTLTDEFDAFAETDQALGTADCKARPPLFLGYDVTQGNVVVSTG